MTDHENGRIKILLIEDDNPVSQLMCEILKERGYEVLCCKTPFYAISSLAWFKADLIITDIVLPSNDSVDGIDVYEIIRAGADNPRIAMIVVSGIRDERVKKKAMEAGAKAYLSKPFEPEDLLECVEDALSGRMSLKHA